VLTTGALAVLNPGQLRVVLDHERAHLAGRHHLLLAVTRSLAAVAPVVPLFARGTSEVARLAEMRADDVARRAGGEQGRWVCYGLALAALTLATVAASALVPVFAVTWI